MTKIAKLKEKRPFKFKKDFVWFETEEEFEVIEEKEMLMMGLGYKIRSTKYNMVLEGFHNAKDFEIIKSKNED